MTNTPQTRPWTQSLLEKTSTELPPVTRRSIACADCSASSASKYRHRANGGLRPHDRRDYGVVSKEMSPSRTAARADHARPEFTRGYAAPIWRGLAAICAAEARGAGPHLPLRAAQKDASGSFHQLDAEVIVRCAAADVELLLFGDQLLRELGIQDGVTLQRTHWGTPRRAMPGFGTGRLFRAHRGSLSEDSLTRSSAIRCAYWTPRRRRAADCRCGAVDRRRFDAGSFGFL